MPERIAELAEVELCIAALIQPEVEQRLARQYGAQLYPNCEAMWDDPTVDAVVICVPSDLHREYTVQALQAGKHVLCEKPMALTLADADAMLEASRQAGRFLMIGHVLRFWPEWVATKVALAEGVVGKPLAISSRRMVSVLAGTQGDRGLAARSAPQRRRRVGHADPRPGRLLLVLRRVLPRPCSHAAFVLRTERGAMSSRIWSFPKAVRRSWRPAS